MLMSGNARYPRIGGSLVVPTRAPPFYERHAKVLMMNT